MQMARGFLLLAGILSASGEPVVIPGAHAEYVYQIAYSLDGKRMVTAAGDNTAIVWDAVTLTKLHLLEHESAVYSAVISPDGKTVATGTGEGQVCLWNPENGQRLKRVQRHADAVHTVVFSPDGTLLATAGGSADGGDAVCRILSPQTLALVKEFAGHERQVYGLTFSPDGKTLVSGSSDKTIRLWDLESGKATVWSGHTSDVYRGAFSPDGSRFASPSQDGTIRIWSVKTGKVTKVIPSKSKDPFYTVAFSPDGKHLAAVGDDRSLHLLDATSLEPKLVKELSDYALYALTFHPKTGLPVVAGEDGRLYFLPEIP